ncbi:ArnT family glycosyltransferase [Jatrophihabitans sp. DSM 45814]
MTLTVVVRLGYLLSSNDRFNGDEAVTGIMVDNILHGKNYAFFAGQNYGGTLEIYLQSLSYRILRLPQDPLTLRFTQLALSGLTCALVYGIASRMLQLRWQALVAAACFAVGPYFNVQSGAMSMAFYTMSQFLGAAGLYCAIRLSHDRRHWQWTLGLGLACGLAYWNSLISAYLLLPTVLWLAPVLLRSWRAATGFCVSAVVGAIPMIPWILHSHHLIAGPTRFGSQSTVAHRFHTLFGPVTREFLGFGIQGGRTQPGLELLLIGSVAVLAAGYLRLFWTRRHGLAQLIRFRVLDRDAKDVLLIAPPITVAIYISSGAAALSLDPRYLVSLYPLLAVGVAAMLPRTPPIGSLLAGIVAVALFAVPCARYFAHPSWQSDGLEGRALGAHARNAELEQVTDFLMANDERVVGSGYWTGMPLQYLAGDRLTVGVLIGPDRFNQVKTVLRAAPKVSYVINRQATSFDQVIVKKLAAHHVAYRSTIFGQFEVIDQISGGGNPHELGLTP